MKSLPLTLDSLTPGYLSLFDGCIITPARLGEVDAFIARMNSGRGQYDMVAHSTGVPWFIIGMIHGLECDFSFAEHLHNGDPLTARTVNEPVGRPKFGTPPFGWGFSAIDALDYENLDTWRQWDVAGICFKLEAYNGFGYRQHGINDPYLWSGSNQYAKGKYATDGHFNPDLVSKQIGAAVVLKRLCATKQIALPAQPV